jgi:Membrane proteins related to metalloendopeptidases
MLGGFAEVNEKNKTMNNNTTDNFIEYELGKYSANMTRNPTLLYKRYVKSLVLSMVFQVIHHYICLMKKYCLLLLFTATFFCEIILAQPSFPNKNYPTFTQHPVDLPISLVGNFGECRPNHIHSGIDIRTNGQENHAVRAVEKGYVSRVKIEPGGFGNAIYITHPNGYTTVYAHLNTFFKELQDYVVEKQYATKSWKQDLVFYPHQFLIPKGKIIARSGNTGSSQGPHLHFEVRDTKTEAPLNPLLFFTQWVDNKAPQFKKLAIYDAYKSIYHQSPKLLVVTSEKGKFAVKNVIEVGTDKIYVGVQVDDYMDAATGTLGAYQMELWTNQRFLFAWQMDNISYDITRYMNAHADYKTKKNGGSWIQLCHQLPGDKLPIYHPAYSSKGVHYIIRYRTYSFTIESLRYQRQCIHVGMFYSI